MDTLKVAVIVFFAALVQSSVVGAIDLGGGRPDVLFVTIVCVALLRGTVVGAWAGFFGGLVADLATLETLGLTSLLLTLAGYWAGRYGETTGRGRTHAPLLTVLVMTPLYAFCAYALHAILGDDVSARTALVTSLLPAIAYNLVLTIPILAVTRRVLGPAERAERTREVRLIG